MFEFAILTVFPAAVAFAGAMDLFTMTIPNRISLALVAGFVLLAPLAGLGAVDVAYHIGAGLLVLAVGVLLFIPGWIGGGDAKLAAAVALWLGFENLFSYLFFVALAGGALALLLMSVRTHPLPVFVSTQPWAVRLHDRRSGIPYGIALAAGALLVYPSTSWFASAIG
ncbi:MAG: peptidase [Rhodospirillales bacterium]|nr:peptidase [Rhodospirillales bacterium]